MNTIIGTGIVLKLLDTKWCWVMKGRYQQLSVNNWTRLIRNCFQSDPFFKSTHNGTKFEPFMGRFEPYNGFRERPEKRPHVVSDFKMTSNHL